MSLGPGSFVEWLKGLFSQNMTGKMRFCIRTKNQRNECCFFTRMTSLKARPLVSIIQESAFAILGKAVSVVRSLETGKP